MGTKYFHLNIPSFHHHHHHHHQQQQQQQHGSRRELGDIPKGYLAIMVGQDEEQEKFIVPLVYISHPLFMQLLKEAEEEYGFKYENGLISIPCQVSKFRHVEEKIVKELEYHHHQHHHHLPCFRV